MSEEAVAAASTDPKTAYAIYWKAWVALLIVTLGMVFIQTKAILIIGMCCKATIISLWFMHLRYEKLDFVLYILLGIFATSLLLFGLIAPDAMAVQP